MAFARSSLEVPWCHAAGSIEGPRPVIKNSAALLRLVIASAILMLYVVVFSTGIRIAQCVVLMLELAINLSAQRSHSTGRQQARDKAGMAGWLAGWLAGWD